MNPSSALPPSWFRQICQRILTTIFSQTKKQLSCTISIRRIFVLPTKSGGAFALAVLAMLITSINYNLALGFAMVFLLIGISFISLIYAARNLWGMQIECGRAQSVFAGEVVYFPFFFRHDRDEMRYDIRLYRRHERLGILAFPPYKIIDGQDNRELHGTLSAKGQMRLDLPIVTTKRGEMKLPIVGLASVFPLGIFRAWCYPPLEISVLIYPQPQSYPLQMAGNDQALGNISGDQGEDDFAGLRERQPAESLRRVNWKAAARQDESRPLQVKHFAGGSQSTQWLDWESLPELDVEKRLSVLTGWVLLCENSGNRYGLKLPGVCIQPACGREHSLLCLEKLAMFCDSGAE